MLLSALGIGLFSLYYTNKMVKEIAIEERKKISQYAEATEAITKYDPSSELDISFYFKVLESNTTIPVILADDKGIITHKNLDSNKIKSQKEIDKYYKYLKENTKPIAIKIAENDYQYVFYDDSSILKKLKVYPFYQLGIVGLFVVVSYFAFSYSRKSEQNQVWVGLAKETAHQLGTPMSSLMAWVELMAIDNTHANDETYTEMRKDLDRLKVITDRFSKIGSVPILKKENLTEVLQHSIDYMKTRSAETVEFHYQQTEPNLVKLNVPLFEWVIENLIKNAIDSMEGVGHIYFNTRIKGKTLLLDISDTGKGISKGLFKRIFNPGFTTKKRGWGLGLSLVKRIIVNYHKGQIFVKESIPNKRTTFRLILKVEE